MTVTHNVENVHRELHEWRLTAGALSITLRYDPLKGPDAKPRVEIRLNGDFYSRTVASPGVLADIADGLRAMLEEFAQVAQTAAANDGGAER